jgi:hypothetical protein
MTSLFEGKTESELDQKTKDFPAKTYRKLFLALDFFIGPTAFLSKEEKVIFLNKVEETLGNYVKDHEGKPEFESLVQASKDALKKLPEYRSRIDHAMAASRVQKAIKGTTKADVYVDHFLEFNFEEDWGGPEGELAGYVGVLDNRPKSARQAVLGMIDNYLEKQRVPEAQRAAIAGHIMAHLNISPKIESRNYFEPQDGMRS